MGEPLVTVLTPVFNNHNFINEALESIVHQSYQNLQILVVDDGSEPAISKVLRVNDDRLQIERMPHKGMPFGLIRRLELAKGKYFVVVDSDDALIPKSIETTVRIMEKNPRLGFCYGELNLMDETGKVYAEPRFAFYKSKESFIRAATVGPLSPCKHSSTLMRMDAIKEVGGYRPEFIMSHDTDLLVRLAKRFEFHHTPELLAYYRTHSNNVTGNIGYRIRAIVDQSRIINENIEGFFRKPVYIAGTTAIQLLKVFYHLFTEHRYHSNLGSFLSGRKEIDNRESIFSNKIFSNQLALYSKHGSANL
jgi:glycosyltransferase involved in cell wall biosynthesis